MERIWCQHSVILKMKIDSMCLLFIFVRPISLVSEIGKSKRLIPFFHEFPIDDKTTDRCIQIAFDFSHETLAYDPNFVFFFNLCTEEHVKQNWDYLITPFGYQCVSMDLILLFHEISMLYILGCCKIVLTFSIRTLQLIKTYSYTKKT